MAVRIDKTVSQQENIVNNYATLKSYLLRRAGRKLNDVEYIGLLRKNALGDLEDPGEALTNILEYVTRVDDAGEIALYGTYKPEDFEITRDFVENEITKSFLTPLKDISLAGGIAGATVATNPRIRLQDRTDLIDSFTGKGSLSNLHKGPTAIFYKTKSGKNRDVGTFRFDGGFDNTTGAALGTPTDTITGGTGQYAGYKRAFMLSSYIKPNSTETVSLVGTGIYLEYDPTATPTPTYTIGDAASLTRLKQLRDILGTATFNTIVFNLTQDFSALTQPTWFTASPGADSGSAPNAGGPDDFNPATTDAVIYFERGKFRLYSEPEYYNSGAYVRDRIPEDDRNAYDGNNITKDSNIKYVKPPRVLSDNTYNWGVRWDGYLRIDKVATARKYVFEVETNTALKIDIYNGGTNFGVDPATITPGAWETVIDTSYDKVRKPTNTTGTGSANYANEEDRFISSESFTLTGLETGGTFKHDTALDGSTQIRYVPISIRMWNGGPDLSDAEQETFEVPLEPNMFLKYGYSETDAGDTDSFYSGEAVITTPADLANAITVDSADQTFMAAIMGDSNKEVVYRLVAKNESVTKEYVEIEEVENEDGTISIIETPVQVTETVTNSISPVDVTLAGSNHTDIVITPVVSGTVDVSTTYTLQVLPDKSDYSFTTLWSTKIIGPKQEEYQGYKDLLGGVTYTDGVPNWIEPLTNKLTLDQRPEWWKVSDGNRYIYSDAISRTNDPLDGFRSNYFASTLKSAEGPSNQYIGLYGDGATPRVFSTRKNLILGEAKYGSDTQGSNYVGMRLTSNYLGEGGKIKFTGIPINKANSDWTGLTGANSALVANDLGGGTNHQTAVQATTRTITLHYDGPSPITDSCLSDKFFVHDNLGTTGTGPTIAQDNPLTHGLPAFGGGNDAVWAQPIIITAVSSNGGGQFVAPLVLSAEKVIYDKSQNNVIDRIKTDTTNASYYSDPEKTILNSGLVYLLAFTTTFAPALSGSDAIDGETLTYYIEADVAFQFKSVDTGESISFSDVLKLTYDAFISATSIQNGQECRIVEAGDTTWTSFGAANNAVGTVFTANRDGTAEDGTGTFADMDLNPAGFNSDTSEVPKVPSERVTPFGFDRPDYTQDICYPPYTTSSPSLKDTVVDDDELYGANGEPENPAGNYDVIWGNHTETGLSGPNFQGTAMALNITEKLEFSYPAVAIESPAAIVQSLSGNDIPELSGSDYSHRLKMELPIFKVDPTDTTEAERLATAQEILDEDIYYHIGNNEKVKDVYYLFVNGREDTSDETSNLKPGMPV